MLSKKVVFNSPLFILHIFSLMIYKFKTCFYTPSANSLKKQGILKMQYRDSDWEGNMVIILEHTFYIESLSK